MKWWSRRIDEQTELAQAVRAGDRDRARRILKRRDVGLGEERVAGVRVWVIPWLESPNLKGPRAALIETAIKNAPHALTPLEICGTYGFWDYAAPRWWRHGQYATLFRRLSGTLWRYSPVTYLIWGRLQMQRDQWFQAGIYLLLSGLYEGKETRFVERFKAWCSGMLPAQVLSQLPGAARTRDARLRFGDRVRQDLSEIPLPPWFLIPRRTEDA